MTETESGGPLIDILCDACQNTHTLILSDDIPLGYHGYLDFPKQDTLPEPVPTIRGGSFDEYLKLKAYLDKLNRGPKSLLYFTCPDKSVSQIVLIPTKELNDTNQLEVISVIDRHSWMAEGIVVSTTIDLIKEISLPNIIRESENAIKFQIVDFPKNGKLTLAKETDIPSEKIDYKDKLKYAPYKIGPDKFKVKVYYDKDSTSDYDIGIFVNVIHSFFPGPKQEQILEFSKDLIPNSVTKLREFINFMVPTVTGVLTAYIGLFSFFGLEKIQQIDLGKGLIYILPVLFMISSLFLFQVAMRPNLRLVRIGNVSVMTLLRKQVVEYINSRIKYAFTIFSIGLFIMGLVFLPLFPTEEKTDNDFSLYRNQGFEYSINYPSYWSVSVYDEGSNVSFSQLDVPIGPKFQIKSEKHAEKPKSYLFAKEQSLDLGINSSTPIPDKVADINGFKITWTNDTLNKIRYTAIDDLTNSSYVIDYTARKIDFDEYLPTVTEMKNSMIIGPSYSKDSST